MKARFHRPGSREEALKLLGELREAAYPIAGGTDLMLRVRRGGFPARHLVGLGDAGLDSIRVTDEGIEIGAAAPLRSIIEHEAVQARVPSLATACAGIGSPLIQTMATLGGNLGNASPCADSATPLLVEGSRIRLASVKGERELELSEFFQGPGSTVRQPDELITSVFVPVAADEAAGGRRVARLFRKYGPRRANVISAVNFSSRIELQGDTIADVRLALGSVAPTPIRAKNAEAWLTGRKLERALLEDDELARAVHEDVSPISDVRGSLEYKTILSVNSVRYALWRAIEEA